MGILIAVGALLTIALLCLTLGAYIEGDSDYAYNNSWPTPFSYMYDRGYDSDSRRDARIEKNLKRREREEG